MMYSVVDVAGLNHISRRILANAAAAVAGMAGTPSPEDASNKPLVGATIFGVTTPGVTTARQRLEEGRAGRRSRTPQPTERGADDLRSVGPG